MEIDVKNKKELLKNVFNTFLVSWIGIIAYIFANFEAMNSTKILLGCSAEIIVSVVLFISAKKYIKKEGY